MKIGIVTLFGNFNYGNRLQNYALEQVIKKAGHEATTVIVDDTLQENIVIKLLKKIKTTFFLTKKQKLATMTMKEKEKRIKPFTDRYLHNVAIADVDLDALDLVFVGSDQVWNPTYIKNNGAFFLDFVDEAKRFSYAASFGVSNLPEEFCASYRDYLSAMNQISVREEAGVQIVHELTDKKAVLVPDPTMLLTNEEWSELIEHSGEVAVKEDQKYILVYVLRDLDEIKMAKIDQFAKANQYRVVRLMGDYYDETHVMYTPIEFLSAIKNAEMVFSDSFHCGVFSIIFKTPFVIFDRTDGEMGSRLTTLLKTFQLEDNLYQDALDFQTVKDTTDFSEVERIQLEVRQNGLDFIADCLVARK